MKKDNFSIRIQIIIMDPYNRMMDVNGTIDTDGTIQMLGTIQNPSNKNLDDNHDNLLPFSSSGNLHILLSEFRKCNNEDDIIRMFQNYLGTKKLQNNQYEFIDQMEFFGPVMIIFGYLVSINYQKAVQWLIDHYAPLNVSYDDNFAYFENYQRNNDDTMAEMIIKHESFVPDLPVIQDLAERRKAELLRLCLQKFKDNHDNHDNYDNHKETLLKLLNASDFDAIIKEVKMMKASLGTPDIDWFDWYVPY